MAEDIGSGGPGLVLVATPIGNLGDMTVRALSELRRADSIACEDTRRTGSLLAHFDIGHTPFIVCNEHREAEAASEIVSRIARGERVALVTDAGMPAISDPGERVVRSVLDAGHGVTAAPGVSAVVAALAMSGLSTERFVFDGFLPRKGVERARMMALLEREERTTVLYEAPHRIRRTIDELAQLLGPERSVVIARELTKKFEDIWRGTLSGAQEHLQSVEPRGEYVVVVGGVEPRTATDDVLIEALQRELTSGATKRDAVDAVVQEYDAPKRHVYSLALDL
ncbi:MAG: 16S rRNA (cytidine(1402)-2'-O)-methyltransferase [Acidimicrobiales bacterium]